MEIDKIIIYSELSTQFPAYLKAETLFQVTLYSIKVILLFCQVQQII